MKENNKFGFLSQGYAAPRAESVEMSNQGMLCASPTELDGGLQNFEYEGTTGSWDNP